MEKKVHDLRSKMFFRRLIQQRIGEKIIGLGQGDELMAHAYDLCDESEEVERRTPRTR